MTNLLLWGGIAVGALYLLKKKQTTATTTETAPVLIDGSPEDVAKKNWEGALRQTYPDLEVISSAINGELICTQYRKSGIVAAEPACVTKLEAMVFGLLDLVEVAKSEVEKKPVSTSVDITNIGVW